MCDDDGGCGGCVGHSGGRRCRGRGGARDGRDGRIVGEQILEQVGLEEASIRVLLHERLDALLRSIERVVRGRERVLCRLSAQVDLEVDLAWRAHRHVVGVDLLALGEAFGLLARELVLLALEPELDVLVAELGLEEGAEESDAVFTIEHIKYFQKITRQLM